MKHPVLHSITTKKIAVLLFFMALCRQPGFVQDRFRKTPPKPQSIQKPNLPVIESFALTNGLSLALAKKKSVPLISLGLIIHAGESSSPPALPGLALFTANMLTRGTANLSPEEIEEKIEFIGGDFSISIYPDYSIFTLTCLESYLEDALKLLSEMILQPEFTRQEIENTKRSMYYDLVEKSNEPEFLAKRLLFQILFNEHQYKNIAYSEEVIKNLNRKDLQDFYAAHYLADKATLVMTGNINLSVASNKVSRHFNRWRRSGQEKKISPPPEPQKRIKFCFLDMPMEKDATIYIGNILTPISDADYFSYLVLNQILGGTTNSRLFMSLREQKAYAYYAFSAVEFFNSCGIFFVNARVRPEVTGDAIRDILNEMKAVVDIKLSSYEIEQSKSYLIGNFPIKLKKQQDMLLKLAEIQAFDLGDSHWHRYYDTVMSIDAEKVFNLSPKSSLLTPLVIIVGDKNILIEHLKELDEINIYDKSGNFQYTIKGDENEAH
ncbi:MAG: insulinase family protein [Candidatus Aminicenantes bacterium]|nr:insulinase family protein [Candidatus Aminicenantes bacterium]